MDNNEKKIYDIHCPNCGAPARFDIISQNYHCSYCGSKVGIGEAVQQKQEFKKIHGEKMRTSLPSFELFQATCEGCGASVVFEENEALSNCAFCGRTMVRDKYLKTKDMPSCIIPFAITQQEAKKILDGWIAQNRNRKEAKLLSEYSAELRAFYLPYELIRGPVHLSVERMDRGKRYRCEGFINDEFVNCSKQLDNLLLDGMEPYDIEELKEFDLAYVAGHRVKTADITDKELEKRAETETEEIHKPVLSKTMETKALDVDADMSSVIKLPVLLPVYYISKDGLMAAINGQTGKLSVRSLKDRHYYFLPWWLKAVVATIVFTVISFLAFRIFKVDMMTSLILSGILAFFFIIVTLCMYSNTNRNSFKKVAGREIFTTGKNTFRRDLNGLVLSDEILERKIVEPVFFEKINEKEEAVKLRFTTPSRVIKMALMCLLALFLPVIIALLLNGFDFKRLELGGSAVWFCIMVPVTPIYLLKLGIEELYDKPLIYRLNSKGKWKRYRSLPKIKITKYSLKTALRIIFIPPASLAFWFAVLSFGVMCYLTAFGF